MSNYNELYRNVWCILGLPFDAVDMTLAMEKVHGAVLNRTPCFISTPNLNFLVASQKDKAFHDSVINSNLSIADGMPLIWIAKFLGLPITERVPGSGLVDQLNSNSSQSKETIKIFFFGGIEGVAERACELLNAGNGQLKCVGTFYPGFGTVDEMSQIEIIENINSSEPDFVIVSLGAKKGQQWIIKNRLKINAPVISHLGAVVNFIAGSINRSPVWMQKAGLEWLWRIYQEPALWKRYVSDGVVFIKLIFSRIIPYKLFLMFNGKPETNNNYSIDEVEKNSEIELILVGVFTYTNINFIRDSFKKAVKSAQNIEINMDGVTYIDSSVIALIMILDKLVKENGCSLLFTSVPKRIKRIFSYNGALFLLKG